MKKGFAKVGKRLLAMLIAVIMLATVGGNLAFAASSPEVAVSPTKTDEAEEVACKVALSAVPAFYTLDTNYWTAGSDVRYDPDYGTEVATFRLSNYAKITRLMKMLYPADQIPYEIQQLTKYNQLDGLKRKVFSGQTQPIWEGLSTTTRRQIARMDAEHALRHIKRKPEYAKNAELRQNVDTYLEQTLSGAQLRAGLKAILPAYAEAIDGWNVRSLLSFARCTAQTPQYQRLYAQMQEINGGSYGVQSLVRRFSYDQAKVRELGLALATEAYLPDAVYALETMAIVLPTAMMPDGSETTIAPDQQSPIAVPYAPKHYE